MTVVQQSPAPAIRGQIFALAITFGTYVAAGALGLLWLSAIAGREQGNTSASLSVIWLAPGFGVACLLHYGRRAWPAILAGSVVVWGLIRNTYLPLSIAEAGGEALSIVLIVTLLRLWGFRPALDRYKDSLLLIAALGLGRIVSSAIDVLTVMVVAWFTTDPHLASVLNGAGVARHGNELVVSAEALRFAARWWANTVAGCLLVVPLLALRFDKAPLRRGYTGELALLAVGVALWIAIGFSLPYAGVWPALLLTAFALVTWAAIRFGVGIAMAATLLLALTASAGFGSRFGAFAEIAYAQRLEAAWGFMGMLIGTSLFLTALIAQRERALRAIAGSAERYRRLFVGNPQPMWVEDAASRRILLANPAALRTYGYAEAEFLALDARNLNVGSDAYTLTGEPSESTDVAVERHRTRTGSEIDVEITRLVTTFGGSRVLVCCAELLTERNQLRLTALTAGDIERFRLGEAIEKQLTPPLARIAATAERLALSPQVEPVPAPLLHSLRADASAAVQVCKGLTRGASPLQSANGDLSEALRRLPATLPERGPSLQVSIRTSGGLALSVERRDHLYRIAEEAVRSAAMRAGAHSVWVTLEVAPTTVRVVIEDDGETLSTNDAAADVALRSIAARAVAAEGQLQIGRSWAGGRIVSFECDQQSEGAAAEPHSDAAAKVPPHGAALHEDPAPPNHPARTHPRWHIGIALLLVASASAWLLDRFLLTVDAEHFWYGSLLPIPYLPFGFAVAALMLGGEWLAGIVFVATLLLSLTAGPDRWALSALDGFCVVISVVVTARALSLWGFRFSCERFRDILLLGAAAGLGQLLERVIYLVGSLMIWVAKPQILPEISAAASAGPREVARIVLQGSLTWWIAGTWGILLVVPAVVSWSPAAWNRLREDRIEVLAWAIGVGMASVALFAISGSELQLPILAGCLALTIWAAVRFGVAAAWTSILLIAISATGSFIASHGVPAPSGSSEGIGTLWGFVILLGATAQLLTTLLADSDQKERNLRQLDARYRRLFEAVPHPLFAVSLAGERIHIANRAARERYGYTEEEFETMSLGDLGIEEPSTPATPMQGGASKITHQHRSKSGEILEVEVARTPVDLDDEPGALCFAINVTERNRLRTQMIEAIDRERRHFSQDFHDGLGQILTGLQLGIEPLLRCAERHEGVPIAAVEFLSTAAREALRACERIMCGLSPLLETGGDLLAALAHLPDRLPPDARGQINVSVSAEDAVSLPLEFREHLYQIAQEATNNSIKHANATRISITVAVHPGEIVLRVEDDGKGFDPARVKGGIGLDSLRLRATALNAQLRILRRAGRGMIVECRCPQARTASSGSDLVVANHSR
ncbi:MAG TPA: PAS domain S-box protein [Steroidobacteraceae bacterium]|nr:PAS domain S-box protein [Steroidobacteraceae bacterium]